MAPSILTTIRGPGKLTARSIRSKLKPPQTTFPLPTIPILTVTPPRPKTIPTTAFEVSAITTIISGLSSTKIDTSPTTTNFPSTLTLLSKSTSFPISTPPSVITSVHSFQTVTEAFVITLAGGASGGASSTILSSALPTVSLSSEGIPTATSTGKLVNGPSMNRILPIAITVPILLISSILLALYILRKRRQMRATLLPHMTSQSHRDFDDWNWKYPSGEFHPITPFDVLKNTENVDGAATINWAKTKRPVALNTNTHSKGLSVHKILNVSRHPSPLAPKKVRERLQNTPETLPDSRIATQGHSTPNVVPEGHSGHRHAPTFSPTRIVTFLMDQVEALQERLQFVEETAHAIGHGEQNTRRGNDGSLEGELIPPPRYTSTISVTVS